MFTSLKQQAFKTSSYGDIFHTGRKAIVLQGATRYARRTWLHTLDDIRAVPTAVASAQFKQDVVEKWVNFGKAYGLNEIIERRRLAFGEKVTASKLEPPLMACHWSSCLCSEYETAHSMRACKGCSEVLYCSKRCQTK